MSSASPAHPSPDSGIEKLPPQVSLELAKLVTLIEKYGFSLAFLFFAGTHVYNLMTQPTLMSMGREVPLTLLDLPPSYIIQEVLLFVFNLFIGIGLLRNSTPVVYPQRYSELLFPFMGTFFALAVNLRESMPAMFTAPLLPEEWRGLAAAVAIPVSVFGYAISIWGIATLGRSFAALVAVRKIVLRGPYRFVRHPIYCGYLFETAGLLLATFSVFSLGWTVLAVGTQVYRAYLEERRLAAASAEYREFQRQVGFLLPGLGKRR